MPARKHFKSAASAIISGVATGTPVTRYIHTDNLGSTNITSDANQNRAQWFDYAPYGSVIASTNTGTTTDARQYIGQFSDASGLSYLNARYYNGAQGQFTSEDPVFWGKQNLQDPQSLNSYSYANDNPITKSDPTGKCILCAGLEVGYSLLGQRAYDYFAGPSSAAVHGGDVVGGAIYGFAYPYAAAFPAPVAAVSAAAGNAAQQGFEYLSGDRSSFDVSQTQAAGTAAVAAQLAVGSIPLPILSGSSLSKQISTKLQKGLISNVSDATLTRIGVSNGPGSVVGNFMSNFAQAGLNRVPQAYQPSFSSAVSASSPLGATISIARAAIQLAQIAICGIKEPMICAPAIKSYH